MPGAVAVQVPRPGGSRPDLLLLVFFFFLVFNFFPEVTPLDMTDVFFCFFFPLLRWFFSVFFFSLGVSEESLHPQPVLESI